MTVFLEPVFRSFLGAVFALSGLHEKDFMI